MSRTSRIPHPPGSRFVPLYSWAVRLFGLAGASIIGHLEFIDRAQEFENQPLASRARIRADLEGIVGKHLIDEALRNLVAHRALKRHENTTMGTNNLVTRVEYGLDLDGLQHLLGTPDFGSSGESLKREYSGLPEPGPILEPQSGFPSKQKESKKEAAAPRAGARDTADAAAQRGKQDRRRRGDEEIVCGVEIWTQADKDGLQRAIELHGAERVEKVAIGIAPALGHRAPYVSAVLAAFQAFEIANAGTIAEKLPVGRFTSERGSLVIVPETGPVLITTASGQIIPKHRSDFAKELESGEVRLLEIAA